MEFTFPIICIIYVIGLALLLTELFIPGLIVGCIGIILMTGSIVLAFMYHNPLYGILLIFVTVIIVPVIIIWVLKHIRVTGAQNVEDGYTSVDETLTSLVGQEGMSVTPLRPVGIAMIGSRRVDVTSENMMVDKNTPLRVVKVEANKVVVKPTGPAVEEE